MKIDRIVNTQALMLFIVVLGRIIMALVLEVAVQVGGPSAIARLFVWYLELKAKTIQFVLPQLPVVIPLVIIGVNHLLLKVLISKQKPCWLGTNG